MRSQEGDRSLIAARPGARPAPGRLFACTLLLVSLAACHRAPSLTTVVPESETIIGRARWQGSVVLLTDAPALVTIDEDRQTVARVPIAGLRGASKWWGLGESDGLLFTVAGFSTLVQITGGGVAKDPIPLERALANLVDLPEGMAAQLAGEAADSALLVQLNDAGRILPLPSPPRRRLGLTSAEENLLQLLSCSVPPRVVCWLPNDNQLFEFAGGALREVARLWDLLPTPNERFLQDLDTRLITDAIVSPEHEVVVLHAAASDPAQSVSVFDATGHRTASLAPAEPLRMFVSAGAHDIRAISRAGQLVAMRWP